MRIVNVMPTPRHMSYGGSAEGGRTYRPGETGPELPLETLHHPLLWKDIAANRVQLRLSDEDLAFLAKVNAEHTRPIVQQKPVRKPKPPKPPKAPKQALIGAPKVTPPPKAPIAKIGEDGPPNLNTLQKSNQRFGKIPSALAKGTKGRK